ncbi:protein XRP2-like [Macrosteles quadrilineatus]|uniref:protein XRP2-like n=1 Tax=Macrosteles quadrilineatus TaxID=74068 RepID=UPI0023E1488A|nr:protein XRP2-like [Macrosteles quadrilineatus]
MGCLCDKNMKSKDLLTDSNKGYSWEKREQNIDPNDFTLEATENSDIWKVPGSINGQQYVVRNCRKSCIYLLDNINTLTIDDCNDCKFIVGPVTGSVFLRDCRDCSCVVACGQFRLRDCHNVNVFLCCPTQPIIESSRRIHFGCYQLYYDQLEDQFRSAGLSVFNNIWSSVHDFTPSHTDINWCLLPATMTVQDYFQPSNHPLNLSLERTWSVVPMTTGVFPEPDEDLEVCLVAFFHTNNEEALAKSFIRQLLEDRPSCWLVSCRQLTLEGRDAEVVFGSSSYNKEAEAGPLVGLVLAGPRVIYFCQKTAEKVVPAKDQVYVSSNPRTSPIQAETFTSVAAMLLYS